MAMRAISIAAGTLLFVFSASPVLAQFGIPGLEESVRVSASPSTPRPGERVHLSAQSVILDISTMSLTWRVNGKVIAQGKGQTEADFTMGALGESAEVTLNAVSDTNTAFTKLTLVPVEVDLLWESDSYTPPFYRGRALPAEGTNIRLQAIPRLKRDGVLLPNDSLKFTWKTDGAVVASASGVGKSSAILPGPVLFGNQIYSVDVSSIDGSIVGFSSVTISSVQGILALFENHPLYGLLLNQPLGKNAYVPENEMTFEAVPLFAPVKNPNDPSLEYVWKINDVAVKADDIYRSAITISANNTTGQALLDLQLGQKDNPYLNLTKQWQILFSRAPEAGGGFGGNTGVNPFTGQ